VELHVIFTNEDGPPSLEAVQRKYIEMMLKMCDGNKTKSARLLGIDRRTLYRTLKRMKSDG
jgi:DNA-binding NtrC family response regulator